MFNSVVQESKTVFTEMLGTVFIGMSRTILYNYYELYCKIPRAVFT